MSNLPSLITPSSRLPATTKSLVCAILAELSRSHESVHQKCVSKEYMIVLRKQLETCDAMQALWIMFLINRTLHMCPPEPQLYISTVLHVQCVQYVMHPSPFVRATAISALCWFMAPIESNSNAQLMLTVIPAVCDGSYLVRFHLLLLLRKFLISFDPCSDAVNPTVADFP